MTDLRIADRCDRCAAQAYVVLANTAGLQLLMCAHHYAQHADALTAQGFRLVHDERAALNVRSQEVHA